MDCEAPSDGSTTGSSDGRPMLLFYCQHSLGLGHLVRSLQLAAGLSACFRVVVLNGGRLPAGTVLPEGVDIVNLPPLGHDETHALISHDPDRTVEEAMVVRRETILRHLSDRPAVVLVELYPFGRRKFAFELMPLLETIEAMGESAPLVVCSLRDILVGGRRKQAEHDERASRIANRFFDAILVHADPQFARLDESFHPHTPLTVPVHYTGFVAAQSSTAAIDLGSRLRRVIVSAGGGMVGGPLFRAAIDAHPLVRRRTGLDMLIVAGPFVPQPVWAELVEAAASSDGLDVAHHVPDLHREIARSAVSVSQCGYNTTMDIVRASTPALVVPYAEGGEDEQTRRADRLERAGVVRVLSAQACNGPSLGEAVVGLDGSIPGAAEVDLSGRDRTATIVRALMTARSINGGAR